MSEKRYAKIIDEETKEVEVGVGCSNEYYIEIGMTLMRVEQAYNGCWYVAGYAPKKPQPTIDEQKAKIRNIRDSYLNNIEWRVSRYRDQKVIEIPTTDTEETYLNILYYMQYLRDYPQSEVGWYTKNPLTFDEWVKKNGSK